VVEFRAVAGNVGEVENRPEDLLHLPDVFADGDLRARFQLHIGCRGEMVGMRMRLEHPVDGDPLVGRSLQDGIHRPGRSLAGSVVEIEDRIDHRALGAGTVPDEIAHRVGGLVEERPDAERGVRGHLSPPVRTPSL
jgi:hypothetical protein